MAGQNLIPKAYDMRANRLSYQDIKTRLDSIQRDSLQAVEQTPSHADYLKQFGAVADEMV
jgi:hypothetical protein